MTPRCPMHQGVETPRGPMYQGVKTPRCPMYRGVAIVDLLMIQNSPKYQGVETPRCPMYRGVKTLKYFVSQNSPGSYVPGSRDSPGSYVPGSRDSPVSYVPGSCKTWPAEHPKQSQVPGSWNSPVSNVPGSLFLFFWTFKPMLQPLKQHSFKKLLNFSIYYTNTVQTYLKNFPSWRFLGRLPGVPSTGESF